MPLPRQNITVLTLNLARKVLCGYYNKWRAEEVKHCPSEFLARSVLNLPPEEEFPEGWDETFMNNTQLYEYALMVLRVNDYTHSSDSSIKGNLNYKKLRMGLLELWRHFVRLEAIHDAVDSLRVMRGGVPELIVGSAGSMKASSE